MSTKYTIVAFLGKNEPPQQFKETEWPLHVTLLDPFATQWTQDELIDETSKLASVTSAFKLRLMKRSFLGPNKDVSVMLLEIDEHMRKHHSDLLAIGEHGLFIYNTPEFVGEGFVPHITDSHDERAEFGKQYEVTALSIVDTDPDGDRTQRKITSTIPLALR